MVMSEANEPAKDYCEQAKILNKAANILEQDISLRPGKRAIANLRVSVSLADWLRDKAEMLDQHYKIWEAEERRDPDSKINQLGGAKVVTAQNFYYALAVAREVIYLDEQRDVRKSLRKNPLSKIFRRSGNRSSEGSQG